METETEGVVEGPSVSKLLWAWLLLCATLYVGLSPHLSVQILGHSIFLCLAAMMGKRICLALRDGRII